MKKVIFCLSFLFVSFFLSIQLYGQSDSLKANVNLSDEVVKKLNNNEIVDIIKYKEKLAFDQEMAEQAKIPIDFVPNTFGISVWIFLTFSAVARVNKKAWISRQIGYSIVNEAQRRSLGRFKWEIPVQGRLVRASCR